MPVYGRRGNSIRRKGETYFTARTGEGDRKHFPYGELEHVPTPRGRMRRSERELKSSPYLYVNTPLSGKQWSLHSHMGFNVLGYVRRLARGKSSVNVLDWGSAEGVAATQLAKIMGEKVNVFGYGNMMFESIEKNPHVTFIQGKGRDLFRFVKKPTFDLIYSSMGLAYVLEEGSSREVCTYLDELSTRLRPGGLIVFSTMLRPLYYNAVRKETMERHWQTVMEELKMNPRLDVRTRGPTVFIRRKPTARAGN